MLITLGDAWEQGWKITVFCRRPKRQTMKSQRECLASLEADVETLVWTRGRAFPIARLESRMKCLRCGSRQVSIAFQPPTNNAVQRAKRAVG